MWGLGRFYGEHSRFHSALCQHDDSVCLARERIHVYASAILITSSSFRIQCTGLESNI